MDTRREAITRLAGGGEAVPSAALHCDSRGSLEAMTGGENENRTWMVDDPRSVSCSEPKKKDQQRKTGGIKRTEHGAWGSGTELLYIRYPGTK